MKQIFLVPSGFVYRSYKKDTCYKKDTRVRTSVSSGLKFSHGLPGTLFFAIERGRHSVDQLCNVTRYVMGVLVMNEWARLLPNEHVPWRQREKAWWEKHSTHSGKEARLLLISEDFVLAIPLFQVVSGSTKQCRAAQENKNADCTAETASPQGQDTIS